MRENTSSSEPQFGTACQHLRCKEMFYDEPGDDGDFSGSVYWCGKTQEAFGPDGEAAEKRECLPGRSCYLGLTNI